MSSLPIEPIPSQWYPISIVSVKAAWKGSSGISYFTGRILEVCNLTNHLLFVIGHILGTNKLFEEII